MRYIDADKLQEEFKELHGGKRSLLIDIAPTAEVVEVVDADENQYTILNKTGVEKQGVWEDVIDKMPTADVVEVVRCKDCKHRKKNTFCLHNMRYEDNNGFCSYGERGKYEKDN